MNKLTSTPGHWPARRHQCLDPINIRLQTQILRSYNDDHHYRQVRLVSVASLTLLLLVSIPTLVLRAYSYSFIESNAEMGFYLVDDGAQGEPDGDHLVAALPLKLLRVPEKLVLVVAMLNVVSTMAHLGFIAWDWKAGRRTQARAFLCNAVLYFSINAILALTALIAIFVSHKASSQFKSDLIPRTPNAVSPSSHRYYRYDSGIFDLETWTCQLGNAKVVGESRADYRKQCEIEVVGRTILVPFFLVALAVASMSVWNFLVGCKQSSRSEQTWTKDTDLELVTADAEGKFVQVEEVKLATLKRTEWPKHGRLSKIEEYEQEAEVPSEEKTSVPKAIGAGNTASSRIEVEGVLLKKSSLAS